MMMLPSTGGRDRPRLIRMASRMLSGLCAILGAGCAATQGGTAVEGGATARGGAVVEGDLPPLPDSAGWGVHVLAAARDPGGT
ncbi:MAG TPA: hypothetical protein VHG35_00095, partial [Gemmatimonadales bacterium]|nr:hypothetical protein [Gemmatimonadales bacterium]